MTTPTRLLTLLQAMGRDGYLDETGGYGVVRVIERTPHGEQVWNPVKNGDQAWEVLDWLHERNDCFTLGTGYVAANLQRVNHGKGHKALREAVVEAACRVAEGMK